MTRTMLVKELESFCRDCTKKLKLPTVVSKGDTKQEIRAPNIHRMRLPDSHSYEKEVPYIIVQLDNSRHVQKAGTEPFNTATVRFIFAVWNDNEQEGAEMLLNLMDTVEIELLKKVKIGKYFQLDVHEPLDSIIYPNDTAPFFAGEMIGTFILPSIKREVDFGY